MTKITTDIKTLTINVMPKEIFDVENAAGRLDPAQPYFVTGMAIDADTLSGMPVTELKHNFAQAVGSWSFDNATNSLFCNITVNGAQANRDYAIVSFNNRYNLKTDLSLALSCGFSLSESTLSPAVVEIGGQPVVASALIVCTFFNNRFVQMKITVKLPNGALTVPVSETPMLVQPTIVLF